MPTSFEVDGVAVLSGWGVDAQRMQSGVDSLTKKVNPVPQGGTVLVYKLGN